MNVEQVQSRNIVHAQQSRSLQEAADLMGRHHVGALLVTEDEPNQDRAIGIVTDRDLVLRALAEGIGPKDATLGQMMTRALLTVAKTASIHEALETMRESGVRRLGVTEETGSVVGIVSLDDIVDTLAAEFTNLAEVIRTERARESVVESAAQVLRLTP